MTEPTRPAFRSAGKAIEHRLQQTGGQAILYMSAAGLGLLSFLAAAAAASVAVSDIYGPPAGLLAFAVILVIVALVMLLIARRIHAVAEAEAAARSRSSNPLLSIGLSLATEVLSNSTPARRLGALAALGGAIYLMRQSPED